MSLFFFFFFNDTATTEIYTLSLHDALPICDEATGDAVVIDPGDDIERVQEILVRHRSEEHTSELQSPCNLVCRLLLEKKKKFTSNRLKRWRQAATPHVTSEVGRKVSHSFAS